MSFANSRGYSRSRRLWLTLARPWARSFRYWVIVLYILMISLWSLVLWQHGLFSWLFGRARHLVEEEEPNCLDIAPPSTFDAGSRYTFDSNSPRQFDQSYNSFIHSPSPAQSHFIFDSILTPSTDLPQSCLSAYFTHGTPCFDKDKSKLPIDVVWTWVNGSDSLHRLSYRKDMKEAGVDKLVAVRIQGRPVFEPQKKLFRDHDELRYSMRSVLKNFRNYSSQFILLASDFAFPSCPDPSIPSQPSPPSAEVPWRLGQLPQWLNMDVFKRWRDGSIPLLVKHHANLFGWGFGDYNGTVYNSLAIESQLANIPEVSENFVYMNDDLYFAKPLSPVDFYTQPYGLVLRMQLDLLVNPEEEIPERASVEWRTLQYTNWLLSKRFGSRSRPYLSHHAKSLSHSLLNEVSHTFSGSLYSTSLKKFRGTPQSLEVYTVFLLTHFVVERWREALLWSWVVGKIGGELNEWSDEEARAAWKDVGGKEGEGKVLVKRKWRGSLVHSTVDGVLKDAGYDGPRSTRYIFSSQDGYPYSSLSTAGFKEWPNLTRIKEVPLPAKEAYTHPSLQCKIHYEWCLGTVGNGGRKVGAGDVFKRVAFENVDCGDCIISALVSGSGPEGLSKFFAPKDRIYSPRFSWGSEEGVPIPPDKVPHLPLIGDWQIGEFSLMSVLDGWGEDLSVREWSMRMAARYRFVLGETPSMFTMIKEPISARNLLKKMDLQRDLALICLNDDVVVRDEAVTQLLREWQSKRWGTKAQWEVLHI